MDNDLQFLYGLALGFETILFSWFQERQVSQVIRRCKELLVAIKESRVSDSPLYVLIKGRLEQNSKKLKFLESLNKYSLTVAKGLTSIAVFSLMLGTWGWHLVSSGKYTLTSPVVIRKLSLGNICEIICVKIGSWFTSPAFFYSVLIFISIQFIIFLYSKVRAGRITKYTEYDADALREAEKSGKEAKKNYKNDSPQIENPDSFSKQYPPQKSPGA